MRARTLAVGLACTLGLLGLGLVLMDRGASQPTGIAAAVPGIESESGAADGAPLLNAIRARRWANATKAALATAGAALLFWGAVLARRGRGGAFRRLRDGLLLALGVACISDFDQPEWALIIFFGSVVRAMITAV